MAEVKAPVPKPVTINDIELRELLFNCARQANAENNSTDTTITGLVDSLMATVKIGG